MHKRESLMSISGICLLFTLLWLSNEMLRNLFPFEGVIVIYLIWFGFSVLRRPAFLRHVVNNSIFLIVWHANVFVRTVVGVGDGFPAELIYASTMLMIYFVFLYYKDANQRTKKIIFLTVLAGYTVSAFTTLYYLSLDPNLIRRSAAGLLESQFYLELYGKGVLNIGGWDYVYSLIGVVLCCLYVYRSNKGEKWAIIFLALSLLFGYVIVNSSLATAVILLVIALVLFLTPQSAELKNAYIFTITVIIIFALPSLRFLATLLSTVVTNENYLYKINQFIYEFDGTLNFWSRTRLMKYSLNTFWDRFFIGVFGFLRYDYSVVSGHVQWIDDLARYGIIFSVAFYLGAFRVVRNLLDCAIDKLHAKVTRIVLFVVLIMGFTNPVLLIHIYLMIFIFVPFVGSISGPRKCP